MDSEETLVSSINDGESTSLLSKQPNDVKYYLRCAW
jgi:hypothetical protein